MHENNWYNELKGAAAFWVAALVFILAGGAFTAVGVLLEKFFLFIGIPFLALGVFVLLLLVYSLYLKLAHPENYQAWLWWVNFIGGMAGALTFALPSTLALPILLLMEMDGQAILIGTLFSVIGLGMLVGIWFVARKQYTGRPRWIRSRFN